MPVVRWSAFSSKSIYPLINLLDISMTKAYILLSPVLNSGGAGLSMVEIVYLVFASVFTLLGVVFASVIIFVGGTYLFRTLGQDGTSTRVDTLDGSDEATIDERK